MEIFADTPAVVLVCLRANTSDLEFASRVFRALRVVQTIRIVAIEVTITAMPASRCCQNTSHPMSSKVKDCILSIRMMAKVIMTSKRERNGPMMSFCVESSFDRHRMMIGILATLSPSVNLIWWRKHGGMIDMKTV